MGHQCVVAATATYTDKLASRTNATPTRSTKTIDDSLALINMNDLTSCCNLQGKGGFGIGLFRKHGDMFTKQTAEHKN